MTWQVPGDLDPAQSRHHLTTHKAAYLKLRYLIDAGAIFVGHGLKKDFRMLNIVVPPSQVLRNPKPSINVIIRSFTLTCGLSW